MSVGKEKLAWGEYNVCSNDPENKTKIFDHRNVGEIPRLNFPSLCMQDSPLGIRFADYASAFPAGGTVASSWDRDVWYQRGHDMGSEHRDKGVDVQLGPVVGPIGRAPEGGRNWEGFSPDPVLSGIAVAHTIKGIQDAGVIACTLSSWARRRIGH